jgi:hypothetical protein
MDDLSARGLEVECRDSYAYGHWTPTWIESYADFVDVALRLNVPVSISGGVPFAFVFFFPRTIEMVCAAPNIGYHIIRIP